MTPSLPWREIPVPDPQSVYNFRLADVDHPYEFLWATDRSGAYAFRFKGRFPLDRLDGAPGMSGISMAGDTLGEWSYFTLVLDNSENAEMFYTLCRSLMAATVSLAAEYDTVALDVIMTRLRRWQEPLQASKGELLSPEEQLGLCGELLVLRDIYLTNLDPPEAIACWTGQLGDEQDFGYAGNLVEVKTVRSTRDRAFTVSSASQLDTASGSIFVAFQTVGVSDRAPPDGMTLNGLADQIHAQIEHNASSSAEFAMRLAARRYFRDPACERLNFMPASRRLFEVTGRFPRIESSELRHGVDKVSYSVDVNYCLPYEIAAADVVHRLLKGAGGASLGPFEIRIEDLSALDESTELEFKSSLRWSYRDSKVDTALENVVTKTIAAFANTRGGRLVIGVDDKGGALSLAKDYATLKTHQNRDGFEQHLYQLMISMFGPVFCTDRVSVSFHQIKERELCLVQVKRVDKLVSVEKVDRSGVRSRAFYVSTGNSPRELGADQGIEYHERRR